jgi:RNA polymerase-binding transcription factor DksA
MAKNKKPVKAVKKSTAKSKPSSAKAKKSAPVKVKKAPAKKVIAKKSAPKKTVAKKAAVKKVAAKKPIAKKAVVTKKVVTPIKKAKALPKAATKPAATSIAKPSAPPVVKPAVQEPVKPGPTQMNMFQMPTQRPIAHKPAQTASKKDERTRYSEDELKEFETLIKGKLEKARGEYKILKETLNRNNDEGTDATSGGNTKVLEDGAETAEKENLSQLAARQQKYITNLENALVRIKNGTYGICSVTGKLISKERLIAVPHTTQSIEAKMMQHD